MDTVQPFPTPYSDNHEVDYLLGSSDDDYVFLKQKRSKDLPEKKNYEDSLNKHNPPSDTISSVENATDRTVATLDHTDIVEEMGTDSSGSVPSDVGATTEMVGLTEEEGSSDSSGGSTSVEPENHPSMATTRLALLHPTEMACDWKSDNSFHTMEMLASQVKSKSKRVFEYFCSTPEVKAEILSWEATDCQCLADSILTKSENQFSMPTLSQADETNLQEIHRVIISFSLVVSNISSLQAKDLCSRLNLTHCQCDEAMINKVFCPNAKPGLVNSSCQLLVNLSQLNDSFHNLQYQHNRQMTHCRPQHNCDNVDVSPLQCPSEPCGASSVTHYTLAGLYSAMLQTEALGRVYGDFANSSS